MFKRRSPLVDLEPREEILGISDSWLKEPKNKVFRCLRASLTLREKFESYHIEDTILIEVLKLSHFSIQNGLQLTLCYTTLLSS